VSGTVLLGFPEYREPAKRLADAAGLTYAEADIHAFPDGESLVRLPPELPRHVIACRSLTDANRMLIELVMTAVTARKLGAGRLTLVAPYLCYMRQDTAFHPGEAVSQRIVGDLLARHFDGLVTVDPHLHRTARLEDAVPVANPVALSATGPMAEWLSNRGKDVLLVGPDEESEQWVSRIAEAGAYDFCVARKLRSGDRDVNVSLPDRDYSERDVVLVDDMATTGRTLEEAARAAAARGARSISVLVTHGLFVGDAVERLLAAGVNEICSTDSVLHETNGLPLDRLLAQALEVLPGD
jgi:ribose-phosphate pyrophosphokinase